MSLNATLGFSTTNLAISSAIRRVMGNSPVSHAWIAFNNPEPLFIRYVLQAETTGIQQIPWNQWLTKGNILKAEFDLDGPELDIKWAIEKFVGLPYDWQSAGLAGCWRWLGRWLQSNGQSPKRLMCSEFVLRVLQHANYDSVAHFNPEVTNPLRLLERVLEMSLKFHEQFAIKMLHNDLIPLAAKAMITVEK
jgi:hypothetical protein